MMPTNHDILIDRAGWGNHPRLTCLFCDVTLLKSPWQSLRQWLAEVEAFAKTHPCKAVEEYEAATRRAIEEIYGDLAERN